MGDGEGRFRELQRYAWCGKWMVKSRIGKDIGTGTIEVGDNAGKDSEVRSSKDRKDQHWTMREGIGKEDGEGRDVEGRCY